MAWTIPSGSTIDARVISAATVTVARSGARCVLPPDSLTFPRNIRPSVRLLFLEQAAGQSIRGAADLAWQSICGQDLLGLSPEHWPALNRVIFALLCSLLIISALSCGLDISALSCGLVISALSCGLVISPCSAVSLSSPPCPADPSSPLPLHLGRQTGPHESPVALMQKCRAMLLERDEGSDAAWTNQEIPALAAKSRLRDFSFPLGFRPRPNSWRRVNRADELPGRG